MQTCFPAQLQNLSCSTIPGDTPGSGWYAVQTRPKHERQVALEMMGQGIPAYVPTLIETHHWSDRRKKVEVPLFSCYAFLRFLPTNDMQVRVLRIPGVLKFVGARRVPALIPPDEIEAIRRVASSGLNIRRDGILREGQRVRIRGGALEGVEGVLVSQSGVRELALNVNLLRVSALVRLDGYQVEPVQERQISRVNNH